MEELKEVSFLQQWAWKGCKWLIERQEIWPF